MRHCLASTKPKQGALSVPAHRWELFPPAFGSAASEKLPAAQVSKWYLVRPFGALNASMSSKRLAARLPAPCFGTEDVSDPQRSQPKHYIVFITDLSSEAGSFASVIIRPSTM